MQPSEVRMRILADHQRIRTTVSELEAIAGRILDGEPHLSPRLRERGQHLYMKLGRHLELEDSILVAALRDTGSFGNERADDLEIEHREQRELLTYLLERLGDEGQPPMLLVRDFLSFASLLRDDMKAEEANLLNSGLLHDDVETTGVSEGSR